MNGIRGTSSVTKLNCIQLEIIDGSGDRNTILLKNVAFSPSYPNNLISISKLSKETKDDFGFFYR